MNQALRGKSVCHGLIAQVFLSLPSFGRLGARSALIQARQARVCKMQHGRVRRPAPALRPEVQEELQRLLLMDAATLNAQLPELSSRLDGYRVMRELLSVAMSGEAESARARHLVRAHAGSPAWQAQPMQILIY